MSAMKKLIPSLLAATLLSTLFAGLPESARGPLAPVGIASAATGELPSSVFLERLNELHAALAAGDPADVQEVRDLRDEIAALDVDDEANLKLLDPVWNKIAAKLPEHADEAELKKTLFRIIKAVGSFRYDPQASHLEQIRSNPEYRAALKTIAAAGGHADIVIDDFLVFLFGNGGSLKGVEGTIAAELAGMTAVQLFSLLGNNEGITEVLLRATGKLLAERESYAFSRILYELGVTAQDIRSLVLNFQAKLQKDVPAINAMTVAYIRTAATAEAEVSEDGRQHRYSLRIFDIQVPSLALQWSKVSGSQDVTVTPAGVATIPAGTDEASAVIRASLINPYGGPPKTIFQQEVTLRATDGEGEKFPAEQFLERMNKVRDALLAGDPADVKAVRDWRDEWAKLTFAKDGALLDPLWNRISPNLPASVDKTELKKSLFNMLVALGSFRYDPEASHLEQIRTNAEYRAALKTLAAAGGVQNVSMDDFLILLFGDGEERGGLEGELFHRIVSLSPGQLGQLFGDRSRLNDLVADAVAGLIDNSGHYPLASALSTLGVRPQDMRSTVRGFQSRFKHDEAAMHALVIAYIRSEAEVSVDVSKDGREHRYTLSFRGFELPSPALQWSKVSGDKHVTVNQNGKVSIPKKNASGTAVIQAAVSHPSGRNAKVVFVQEVTLGSKQDDGSEQAAEIVAALDVKLVKIGERLASAKTDLQKVTLILDTARAGNDAARSIAKLKASSEVKSGALAEIKSKVNGMMMRIIRELLDF